MSETATVPLPCPICGADMELSLTTNRNGKHAVGVHCARDGRHFRGFINHRPFVEGALDRLLAAEANPPTLAGGGAPEPPPAAVQKPPEPRAPARSPTRRRRA